MLLKEVWLIKIFGDDAVWNVITAFNAKCGNYLALITLYGFLVQLLIASLNRSPFR